MLVILFKLLLYLDELLIANNYLFFSNKFKSLSKSTKNFNSLNIVNFVLQQTLLFLLSKNLILF